MTIIAKYASTCPTCKQPITPGDQVEWSNGQKARHNKCPTVAAPKSDPGTIRLYGGSGYGCEGWTVGEVVVNKGRVAGSTASPEKVVAARIADWRAANPAPVYTLWEGAPTTTKGLGGAEYVAAHKADEAAVAAWKIATHFDARSAEWRRTLDAYDEATRAAEAVARQDLPDHDGPEYLVILTAKRRYVRDDGMSFGVGDDQGYVYEATARAATDEESAPLHARLDLRAAARNAVARLKEIASSIVANGERPDQTRPTGEVAWSRDGGSGGYFERIWIDQAGQKIWHDRYNGADRDDWSYNNYGGYAIVRSIQWSEKLECDIRTCVAILIEAA